MRKILFLVGFLLICGCGKFDQEDLAKKFSRQVKKAPSYHLKGVMEIRSNEDVFTYNLDAVHQDDDFYRVSLINQLNNHEQIILKNNDGVYVITPSLNKSFKFQSDWPANSSQAYILESIVKDMETTKKLTMVEKDNKYELKANVNYANNPNLAYQILTFDKKLNLEKVVVYDKDKNVKIMVKINDLDFKEKYDESYFALENNVKEDCCSEETSETSKIEDIIYPLYLPADTYLQNKETIDTEEGNRVILTFEGKKPFVLIEEKAASQEELELIPVYGEPLLFDDSLGALSANSLMWTSNKIDYYITSNSLSGSEMQTIASSLNTAHAVINEK